MLVLPRSSVCRAQKGQSLIELILVMSVLVILSAIALPQLRQTRNLTRFSSLQREIITQLRDARQQAIAQRQPVTLRYDDANKRLLLYGGIYGPAGDAANKKFRLTGRGLRSDELVYGRPAGAPVTPLADATDMLPLTGGYADITFQPDGAITDGNGNPLAHAWFFYHANMPTTTAFAVSVLGFGGRVKDWKYNSMAGVYEE